MSPHDLAGVINAREHPQILVIGIPRPGLDEALAALAPIRRVESIQEVHESEWDVVVTDRDLGPLPPRLSVIYIAVGDPGTVEYRAREWDDQIVVVKGHAERQIRRVGGLSDRLDALVRAELEPAVQDLQARTVFERKSANNRSPHRPAPEISPFLTTRTGAVLAGRYMRSPSSECWLLPVETTDLARWVRAALSEWHNLDPEAFPGLPDWSDSDRWSTVREQTARRQIEDNDETLAAAIARHEERAAELARALAEARTEADDYERKLLTGTGDELKLAVIRALRELGFDVADADLTAPGREHREDLRLTDPGEPDWVALGEVKGVIRGAETGALLKLTGYSAQFALTNGALPSALWFVVNQFRQQDPDTRMPPFGSVGRSRYLR